MFFPIYWGHITLIKMAASENDLTWPIFDLGICSLHTIPALRITALRILKKLNGGEF